MTAKTAVTAWTMGTKRSILAAGEFVYCQTICCLKQGGTARCIDVREDKAEGELLKRENGGPKPATAGFGSAYKPDVSQGLVACRQSLGRIVCHVEARRGMTWCQQWSRSPATILVRGTTSSDRNCWKTGAECQFE
jgi:hypothetical protein